MSHKGKDKGWGKVEEKAQGGRKESARLDEENKWNNNSRELTDSDPVLPR